MKSASDSILRRIRAKQRGWVFTPKNFIDLAPRNTIGVALHRLVEKGIIRKIGHGIYDFPIVHPKLGLLAANPNAIVKALAFSRGDAIQPSGAQLANQLGFDTQVSAKPTYNTSGSAKQKNVARYPITFNHSKFLNKAPFNSNVVKVITALHHIGKNNITDEIIQKSQAILSAKDKIQLKKNINQLPDWLVQIVLKIIGK